MPEDAAFARSSGASVASHASVSRAVSAIGRRHLRLACAAWDPVVPLERPPMDRVYRLVVCVVVSSGCWSPAAPVPTAAGVTTPANVAPAAREPRGARLVGRVMLGGSPVRDFAIALTPSFKRPTHLSGVEVHTKDGRFDTVFPASETADVIIAGPGFLRHAIAGVALPAGEITDLGVIDVVRGHTIQGRLTDEQGQPVAGAPVTIHASPAGGDGSLASLLDGDSRTTTDRDGRYEITGVGHLPMGYPPRISSVIDGRLAALDRRLPDDDATIDLVMHPVGQIGGSVTGVDPKREAIVIRSVSDPAASILAPLTADGAFHLDNVPADTYDVMLLTRTRTLLRITVIAGQAVDASFAAP